MEPVLFDTTIWIDYLNGVKSKATDLLDLYIAEDKAVFICPIIVQEILQGIKDDNQYQKTKKTILGFRILEYDIIEMSVGAADLYRSLRKKGVSIRKSADCLIAHYAIFFNVQLLHNDGDFNLIGKHSALKIHKLSFK